MALGHPAVASNATLVGQVVEARRRWTWCGVWTLRQMQVKPRGSGSAWSASEADPSLAKVQRRAETTSINGRASQNVAHAGAWTRGGRQQWAEVEEEEQEAERQKK